ncbi:MAG: tyrosine phosphatase family protein [Roseiarcus sp.]
MPRLHVCSLARIEEMAAVTGAGAMVTLLSPGTAVVRPAAIAPENHLYIEMSDIVVDAPGQVAPQVHHIDALLDFVHRWDRVAPMLIHCFAGVSRSTASAFIAACALAPHRDEYEIAQSLRKASPTATPNSRFVALADARLGRGGRMCRAIDSIGRGVDCFEGAPFALDIA